MCDSFRCPSNCSGGVPFSEESVGSELDFIGGGWLHTILYVEYILNCFGDSGGRVGAVTRWLYRREIG